MLIDTFNYFENLWRCSLSSKKAFPVVQYTNLIENVAIKWARGPFHRKLHRRPRLLTAISLISRYISTVKPTLKLCWGACHPQAPLTLTDSDYISWNTKQIYILEKWISKYRTVTTASQTDKTKLNYKLAKKVNKMVVKLHDTLKRGTTRKISTIACAEVLTNKNKLRVPHRGSKSEHQVIVWLWLHKRLTR